MDEHLQQLINDATSWLNLQQPAEPQSAQWYAHGNLRTFIQTLSDDPSEIGVEKAVRALGYHISDQYDWSTDYCKSISEFCHRADRISRSFKRRSAN